MEKIMNVYTVEEVAKALKLHPYTIRRYCREGKIPVFRIGGQWRFRKSQIEAWAKKQEKGRAYGE